MFVKIKKLMKIDDSNICYLSKDVYNKLGLNKNQIYKINLANVSEYIYIHPKNIKESIIYFPKNIFKKLLLFSDIKLNIWNTKNELFLGPIVGVFVNERYIKRIENKNPPSICLNHIDACKFSHCLTYFFSVEDVDFNKKRIKGFVFAPKQNDFRKYLLPFPNILYDKGTNFKEYNKKLAKSIREHFRSNANIHFINNKDYLDKWYLYKRLKKYENLKKYLPETIRYKSFNDLEKMIDKYSFVFIKSFYGSKGKEVMSIKKINNKYVTNFYDNGINIEAFKHKNKLKNHVNNFIKNRKFIVQEGIKLSKYNKRKFDLRILIQKDIYGKWIAVYNIARLAKEKIDITNYSTGAELINYSYIYNSMNNSKLPTDKVLRKKAILIAKYIEKEYGSFGELGIDLAIVEDGSIKFIEANTKPDKTLIDCIEGCSENLLPFISIFNYSKFLIKKG